eukprot:gene9720-13080_t
MRKNINVEYVLINVIEDGSSDDKPTLEVIKRLQVPNFTLKVVTLSELSQRVKERLGIDVKFTKEWYYKLCDYKPTLAYLFPEMFDLRKRNGNLPFRYWGYGDMDVIWGNLTRFSHWFQGDYTFIISGWCGTTGAAAFYPNERWTIELFKSDEKYIPLLKDLAYHNLDEGGTQTNEVDVVDGGSHSISLIQGRYMNLNNTKYRRNEGVHYREAKFIDENDSKEWAGITSWINGRITIIRGNDIFPPGREVMFYHHRTHRQFVIPSYANRTEYIEDMIEYGYLLPSFIPLMSRYSCMADTKDIKSLILPYESTLTNYYPYKSSCNHNNNVNSDHSIK